MKQKLIDYCLNREKNKNTMTKWNLNIQTDNNVPLTQHHQKNKITFNDLLSYKKLFPVFKIHPYPSSAINDSGIEDLNRYK